MTKRAVLIVLLLPAIASSTVWLGQPAADPGAEPAAPAAERRAPSQPSWPGRVADAPDPVGDSRGRVTIPSSITVSGRCIDARLRHPLVGCAVTIAAAGARIAPAVTVFTDSAGRFSRNVETPAARRLSVAIAMAGRVGMRGLLATLPAAVHAVDLGDIALALGTRLLVRVESERGRALPGVRVRFTRRLAGETPALRPVGDVILESDASGTIATGEPVARGAWTIRVPGHLELIRPLMPLEIAGDQAVQRATIVVRSPDPAGSITGVVLDSSGHPVEGAEVRAEAGRATTGGVAVTDERGAFHVVRASDGGESVRLRVRRASGFDDLLSPASYEWGSRGVVLRLRRAGAILLTVVAADTARPVEHFAVHWFQVDTARGRPAGSRGAAAHHRGGIATVEGVPGGHIRLVVAPGGREFAPSDPVELDHAGDPTALRIALERRRELPVRVVFGDGRPVQGTALELVRPGGDASVSLHTHGLDPSRRAELAQPDAHALLLDESTTDRSGRAVLRWIESAAPLAIRVLGPGHLPVVEHGVVVRSGAERLEIVVHRGATFSGVVRPRSVLEALGRGQLGNRGPQGPTMVLTYLGDRTLPGRSSRRVQRLGWTGEFEFTGLRAGRWAVMFRNQSFDPKRVSNLASAQFAPILLSPDTELRAEYDIGDLAPATLRGQVMLDGRPAAERRIELVRVSSAGGGPFVQVGSTSVVTDRAGFFVAAAIRPGRYHAAVPAPVQNGRRQTRLMCPEAIVLVPGADVSRRCHIRAGVLEVQITDARGEPASERYFIVHSDRTGFRTTERTDAAGVLRVDPIAAGSYTISVGPRASGTARPPSLGEVVVASGGIVSRAWIRARLD